MGNKHFVLSGVVKVITFGFFGITNEGAFIRFWAKLICKHTFNISIRTPNFQKRKIGNLSNPHLVCRLLLAKKKYHNKTYKKWLQNRDERYFFNITNI